jgi:hypothetical protein
VAWDGEGLTTEKIIGYTKDNKPMYEHVYALLMNSKGDSIDDSKGLSTVSCLYFLTETELANKNAIHVCYGASYDVNMLLRDVPYEDLEKLYAGDKIIFDRYELEYRPRKSLIVRRMSANVFGRWKEVKRKDGSTTYEKIFESKLTLWDVIGFFQGTFLKALESYHIPHNTEDIKAGKERRGSFTRDELDIFIKPYCLLEVQALVLLMEELHRRLKETNLKITRWDGAGACASALLQRENVKAHLAETPQAVQYAAQHAYSGGRIEPLMYGHYSGPIHHYDINSAYPAAMLHLPSLADGEWMHVRQNIYGLPIDIRTYPPFGVWKVSWAFPETHPLYPFPYRTKGGSILFPPHGKNWIWGCELLAALETFPNAQRYIHIEEGHVFYPRTMDRPFHFLPELFDLRARWKIEENGAEKALKLAINSLYGKMVQQLGFTSPSSIGGAWKRPPFHQLEYGGYVTAYTRSELFRACMQNPKAIISLATDGIYSIRPLELPCGTKLGQWGYHIHSDMTLVTSGVYWYSEEGEEHAFYRGFDSGTLTRQAVLDAWEKSEHSVIAKSTRFITLGAALLPNGGNASKQKRFKEWRSWKTIDRELRLDMTHVVKRLENHDVDQSSVTPVWENGTPNTQLIRTRARTIRFLRKQDFPFNDTYTIEGIEVSILSSPYKLVWDQYVTQEDVPTVDGIPSFEYERQHLDTFV